MFACDGETIYKSWMWLVIYSTDCGEMFNTATDNIHFPSLGLKVLAKKIEKQLIVGFWLYVINQYKLISLVCFKTMARIHEQYLDKVTLDLSKGRFFT